jgi:hypothetical protein
MIKETIEIGKLFQQLVDEGRKVIKHKDYEMIYCGDIEVKTIGNKYSNIEYISRHKTPKNLVEITIKTDTFDRSVTVTTDHVCMIYTEDHFFENVNAKNVKISDIVSVYDEKNDMEIVGEVISINNIGLTDDYVYDLEVDDEKHSFYANDILIHNSQFVSIRCITEYFRNKYNLPEKMIDWSDDYKLKLWKYVEDFVENDLNKYVQNLVREVYHSENPEVLRYSLEYIGDTGIYESKKHYGVRKILEDTPEILANEIKYSGIELKKASIPKKIKEYLGEIYNSALTKDWNDNDFKNYILKIYPEFEKLDINDIAIWKGYNTSRQATGFLKMEKGTTGIAKAATFYNQLISKQGLNIASKYDSIRIGDKVRVCYIKPTNKYNIDVIAFNDGQYPDEFKEIFQIDYEKMFDKLIKSPLKNFLIACKWKMCDPNNCNIMDIDDL